SNWQQKGIEGKSDKDGNIAIAGMQPGKFTFEVQKKGYTRWWSPDAMQPHQQKQVEAGKFQRNFDDLDFMMAADMQPVKIELEKAVTITGIAQDPDGNPVAGATVAPAKTGSGNSLTGDTRFSVVTKKD